MWGPLIREKGPSVPPCPKIIPGRPQAEFPEVTYPNFHLRSLRDVSLHHWGVDSDLRTDVSQALAGVKVRTLRKD